MKAVWFWSRASISIFNRTSWAPRPLSLVAREFVDAFREQNARLIAANSPMVAERGCQSGLPCPSACCSQGPRAIDEALNASGHRFCLGLQFLD